MSKRKRNRKALNRADIALFVLIGAGLFISLAVLKGLEHSALVLGGMIMWSFGSVAGIQTVAGVFGQLQKGHMTGVISAGLVSVLFAIALMLVGGEAVAKTSGLGIALSVFIYAPFILAAKFGDH